ncbi:MAG: bifunctional histidine phosphatase family protein/GNAT family N-acetyltransferase [Oscillospiraceae bacterium]|nr:bifunctional histidine phosphatase family protein/GNAT family N-acetyltransferase [Oscillospiraceae bacterium]
MTRIYLIRHAEAEGNVFRRAHGQYDSPLTPKGYRQVEALAERFKDEKIDALYSSDLRRTMATAGAILKYHNLTLQTTPRLREVALGVWEDCAWGNLTRDEPENMWAFNNDPDRWHTEGGEPFAEVRARLTAVLAELAERHEGQTIACFSHGMAIRSYLCSVLGVPSERIVEVPHGDNTCVALLEYTGGEPRVCWYNSNSHLASTLSTLGKQEWWKAEDCRDPFDLCIENAAAGGLAGYYADCYRRCWGEIHGTEAGFDAGVYVASARRSLAQEARSVAFATMDGRNVGVVHCDMQRGAESGAGWISLCYVEPDVRGMQVGTQLIGHAVSLFRSLGRSSLCLSVAQDNTAAQEFYKTCGFAPCGVCEGAFGLLNVMERPL